MPETAETWASTTTVSALAAWLRTQKRLVVLTHVKPDGDAVGSSLALVRAFNALKGGGAEAWYFGPQPPWYSAIHGGTPARVLEHQGFPPRDAPEPDAVVVIDTGSWKQLEPAIDWLKPRRERIAVVDHHATGNAEVGSRRLVEVSAAAACQIASELCRELLGKKRIAELPLDVATACYLGIATDTGWFRHSNVTPAVLRCAAELIEAGVDAAEIYRVIEQQDRPARVMLLGRALSTLRIDGGGRVASMVLTRKDFQECGAEQGDAGGFADYAQTIETVRVVAMLTESEPDASGGPVTKISLRSKSTPDSPDVNAVANQFDGGGHVRAAGARVAAPIGDVRERIVRALAGTFA